ncbi:MAG: hypothetical protein RMJ98_14315 [Myxococcales bacterium]|nr:hypothetical protein [Myxococcales bacterium]
MVLKLEARLSGELIVASDMLEAHVFLQDGRIVWAYSNATRGLFLQELREKAQIEEDVLKDVLEECRRERRHVAETLISWGLASVRDVRRALWVQIGRTLEIILETPGVEAIFLRRATENYSQELTFSLSEFDRKRFSSTPPAPEDPALLEVDAALQQQLQQTVPSMFWGRLLRRGSHSTRGGALNLVNALLSEVGVIECACRDARGWLYALQHPEGYFFCGLRPDSPLSGARKALLAQLPPSGTSPELNLGKIHAPQANGCHQTILRSLFEQVPLLAGGIVLARESSSYLEREGCPPSFRQDVEKVKMLLQMDFSSFLQTSAAEGAPMMTVSPGLRLTLPTYQLFGAKLDDETQVWLAFCPTMREQMGWGLLMNVLRTLHRQPA